MNVLALDVGGRRIGVAIASLEAKIANPLLTIDRRDTPDVFACIKVLADKHNVTNIVVGLPRGMDGQETGQTVIARNFAKELEQLLGIQVFMQDEAATSIVAEDELKASGKMYQKADIDKLAATIILNDWLANEEISK